MLCVVVQHFFWVVNGVSNEFVGKSLLLLAREGIVHLKDAVLGSLVTFLCRFCCRLECVFIYIINNNSIPLHITS